MADNFSKIGNGSPERVAYDLMLKIEAMEHESKAIELQNDPRKYYLELYAACRKVATGSPHAGQSRQIRDT